MNDEPTFPTDAFGQGPETMPSPAPPANGPAATTEPLATKSNDDERTTGGGGETPAEVAATVEAVKTNLWPAAGVAIGIGSAAIAAALLYRSRR